MTIKDFLSFESLKSFGSFESLFLMNREEFMVILFIVYITIVHFYVWYKDNNEHKLKDR